MTISRNLSFLAEGVSSTGVLGASNGGSGATTLTGYLYGNGTSAFTASTTIPTSALSGTISNAQLANSSLTVNGTSISLGGSGTVTAAAGTLTGTTLNSTVVSSSLTSVGTLTSGTWNASIIAVSYGGTGLNSLNAGYIPYGNGTSAFGSSSGLTYDGTNLKCSGSFQASGTALFIGNGLDNSASVYATGGPVFIYANASKVATFFSSGGVSIGNTTDPGASNLSVTGTAKASAITPTTAPSTAWGLDFAPSSSNGSYVSIANGATYDLASGSGMFFIWDDAGNGVGTFYAYYGSLVINFQNAALFTNVSGTASKVNVYYNAGTGKYRIQNNFGSTLNFYISTMKLRLSA